MSAVHESGGRSPVATGLLAGWIALLVYTFIACLMGDPCTWPDDFVKRIEYVNPDRFAFCEKNR